ncbi:MAG TPA: polymorphic toxin-type HINT domain-containing protein [Kineosporiaceae bacterium]|nr:polymorphic toxin-type HINT domain-containing protein [Kineosporiaceae bacterium]
MADDAGESGLGTFVDDACGMMHSFAPDTEVVMADGSRKPIGEVKLGDKVLATNPDTGTTEVKPVVALHHNEDTDLTDVTVRVPAPRTSTEGDAARQADATRRATAKDAPPIKDQAQDPKSGTSIPQALAGQGKSIAATGSATPATVTVTVHTTSHHPFWDQTTGTWADAADLKPGDHLHALGSNEAVVVAVRSWTGHAEMNDLTIDDTHTYYVVTADTSVLVHNVAGGKCAKKVAKWYELIIKPPKDGWNPYQMKQARAKIKALQKAKLVKTDVAGKRHGSASSRWKRAGKTKPANHDIDHVIELQLGGRDEIENMKPLDSSVNRSFGSQFKNQLKKIPLGARIRGVRLVPRT